MFGLVSLAESFWAVQAIVPLPVVRRPELWVTTLVANNTLRIKETGGVKATVFTAVIFGIFEAILPLLVMLRPPHWIHTAVISSEELLYHQKVCYDVQRGEKDAEKNKHHHSNTEVRDFFENLFHLLIFLSGLRNLIKELHK